MELKFKVIKHLEDQILTKDEFSKIKENLAELEYNSFKEKAFNVNDLEYEYVENPFSVIIFAYLDDKLVGFLDYWITFDSATIDRIGVDSNYQGQGIGNSLMNEMFNELKNNHKDVSMITLEVRVSNKKAIALYEKCGFKKITIKKNYYDNVEDGIYMGKGM